ncbi:hypothetical protein yberc0001_3260 [Yersinia bercovieri ATCC 43970]|uniref:Uncharacterized protein n=1 Tax=Yersinia bercovieri ATCC 43970 TaxID=349968 RepID=A0ABM9Y0G8_YERBE|nr:hypothetical protein yberc0001_3260 [Yersinia bercovieri ATCC 43970]
MCWLRFLTVMFCCIHKDRPQKALPQCTAYIFGEVNIHHKYQLVNIKC